MFNTIKITIVLTLVFVISPIAQARTWPIFSAPTKATMEAYVDTQNCPSGMAKLPNALVINFGENQLCKTYCLKSWQWVSFTNNECLSLKNDFDFLRFEITRVREGDGTADYSKVVAFYGNSRTGKENFSFSFTSAPHEHWFCIESSTYPESITCANDI